MKCLKIYKIYQKFLLFNAKPGSAQAEPRCGKVEIFDNRRKGEIQMKILSMLLSIMALWLLSASELIGSWAVLVSYAILFGFVACQYIAGKVGEKYE